MNREEFVRIRTDTFLSIVQNQDIDHDIYLKALDDYYGDSTQIEKERSGNTWYATNDSTTTVFNA